MIITAIVVIALVVAGRYVWQGFKIIEDDAKWY